MCCLNIMQVFVLSHIHICFEYNYKVDICTYTERLTRHYDNNNNKILLYRKPKNFTPSIKCPGHLMLNKFCYNTILQYRSSQKMKRTLYLFKVFLMDSLSDSFSIYKKPHKILVPYQTHPIQ